VYPSESEWVDASTGYTRSGEPRFFKGFWYVFTEAGNVILIARLH